MSSYNQTLVSNSICGQSGGFPPVAWRKVRPALVVVLLCSGTLYLLYNATRDPRARTYKHLGGWCTPGEAASRAAHIVVNFSRHHPSFLQLSDFLWRKKNSSSSLPYGTNGSEDALMQALAVLSSYEVPAEIERRPCRCCVVVGNGFQIMNSSLGEMIDSHDVVIRINNAPVKDYERDVGSKTTFRLFYPESAHFDLNLDNNPDTLFVLVPFKTQDVLWIKTMVKNEKQTRKGFWKAPPIIWDAKAQNIRIQNPYFVQFAATKLLGYHHNSTEMKRPPTTGLIAISFAIHFCDQVRIAGFGYPTAPNTTPIHYYNNETMKDMAKAEHNVTMEHLVIRRLLYHRVIHNLTML